MVDRKMVVVLGASPEQEVFFRDGLKDFDISFARNQKAVLKNAHNADLIAVNIDRHNDFLKKMVDNKYAGKVVAMTSNRRSLNKQIHLPSLGMIRAIKFHSVPHVIMRALAR